MSRKFSARLKNVKVRQYYRDDVLNNFLYILRNSYNILDKKIRTNKWRSFVSSMSLVEKTIILFSYYFSLFLKHHW